MKRSLGRPKPPAGFWIATLAAALAFPLMLPGQNLYSLTDLGTLGGLQSSATAINNAGQVVGSANLNATTPLTNHAFLYQNGLMIDLGVLGDYVSGLHPVSSSTATAINRHGQIVGWSYTTAGAIHAFLWDQKQMTDLGTLPGTQQSKATGINDSGQIVGASVPSGPQHAFLFETNTMAMTDLGTLGGAESFAYGINSHGEIVGDSWTNNSGLSDLAFVWTNSTMTTLGVLSNRPAILALAINDGGQIVGYDGGVDTGGPTTMRGYLRTGGNLQDLGNLGGALTNIIPESINNRGQIVGNANSYQGTPRAFLSSGYAMTNLNTLLPAGSGWTLLNATGINDNGQIVGYGQNPALQQHAYLLTPRPALQNFQILAGRAQFEISGMTNTSYQIEYSFSLPATNWLPLTNLDLTISPTPIQDPAALSPNQKFYRARQH